MFIYGEAVDKPIFSYYMLSPKRLTCCRDHVVAMERYPDKKIVNDSAFPVYGRVSFDVKLSESMEQDNKLMYVSSFQRENEVMVSNTTSKENVNAKKRVVVKKDEVKTTNRCVLTYVPKRFIFQCKNSDYLVVSIRNIQSDNLYSNLGIKREDVTPVYDEQKQETGFYHVNLHCPDWSFFVSSKKNGHFVKEKMTAGELVSLYERGNQQKSQESSHTYVMGCKTKDLSSPLTKNSISSDIVYINHVSEKCIYPTKNPDICVVSFPWLESKNGFAKASMLKDHIFRQSNQTSQKGNYYDIKLGKENGILFYSILSEDGQYIRNEITAKDFANKVKNESFRGNKL